MDSTAILAESCAAVEATAGRLADLLRSLPHSDLAISGSKWTVRDTAAHLVSYGPVYGDIVEGTPSPITLPADGTGAPPVFDGARYRAALEAASAGRVAGIAESDPAKLADLVVETATRLVEVTAGRHGDQPITFHCGLPFTLAGLIGVYLGEQLLHGYDMAGATGCPWPLDPAPVALVHLAYAPLYALCVNRDTTAGLNVAYEVELRGLGSSLVRFTDGDYAMQPAGSSPVDCTISADPVAYLLVASGRLTPTAAIALGLLSAGGPRPELAGDFGRLFIFP